nr:hypothetical protein [Rhizobium sp. 3T7]
MAAQATSDDPLRSNTQKPRQLHQVCFWQGLLCRNPCAASQPLAIKKSACSTVSTPSAIHCPKDTKNRQCFVFLIKQKAFRDFNLDPVLREPCFECTPLAVFQLDFFVLVVGQSRGGVSDGAAVEKCASVMESKPTRQGIGVRAAR